MSNEWSNDYLPVLWYICTLESYIAYSNVSFMNAFGSIVLGPIARTLCTTHIWKTANKQVLFTTRRFEMAFVLGVNVHPDTRTQKIEIIYTVSYFPNPISAWIHGSAVNKAHKSVRSIHYAGHAPLRTNELSKYLIIFTLFYRFTVYAELIVGQNTHKASKLVQKR